MVIEHNLDVIKTADHIIDIGPEGGDRGGTVIARGTPEEVAENPVSYTGKYVEKISGTEITGQKFFSISVVLYIMKCGNVSAQTGTE